jgi:hypothetical protein
VQKALEMQQEQFLKQLPSIIKSQSVTEQLSSNPLLSNPATRPILDAVKQQLVTKFPDASSSEITKFANEYLTEFAKQISGPQAATTAGGAPKAKDFDWSEHFFGKA